MPANINVGNVFSDKFDSDGTIKKLVELEKSKADKWKNDKFILDMRRKAWEGLQKKLKEIDTAARQFYNPINSPFRKMKTKSEDENVLTGTAISKAEPGDYKFTVKRLATADTFRSDVVKRTYKLPGMKFEIQFGDKKIKARFRGGSIDAFAKYVNERAKDSLKAVVLKVDDKNAVLSVQGSKTGSDNRVVFKGDLEPLEKIGLLKKYTYSDVDLKITNPTGLGSKTPYSDLIRDKALYLAPLVEVEKLMATPQKGGDRVSLKFKFKIQDYKPPKTVYDEVKEAKVGFIDKVWVGEVDIQGENLLVDPNFGEAKKKISKDKTILIINYQGTEEIISFIYDKESTEWQEISIPLKADYVNRVSLRNPFTNKEIYLKEMKIVDDNKKGFLPKNAINRANDAEIEYKGVSINRPENKIDDLVPGLTLYLKGTKKKPVNLNIDWNYEGIREKIFEFVVMYNNAMDYIKNLTRAIPPKNPKQTTKWRKSFEKMSGEEAQKKAKDGMLYEGILNGKMTVNTIKYKIRQTLMRPYKTRAERKVMFLVQMGIENPKYSSGASSKEDRENLRAGFLEFNKEKFEKVLKDHYRAVQEFFYRDSNGDLIFDTGMAVELSKILKMIASDSFRGEGGRVFSGMIKSRLNMIASAIKMKERSLERWERHVKEYETRLRNQFMRMHRAMKRSESQGRRLQGFNSNNSNR